MSEPASISAGIAARYAQAVFDLAKDDKALKALESDVDALDAALKASADLRDMIASPVLTREDQGAAIAAIAKKMKLSGLVANTLALMASKRRLFVLPHLVADLRARIAAEKEALRAAKEAARLAEREAKEKAKQEALAAAARRKPEPPPKPPIIKTEFEDGIQATKEFDLKFLASQRSLLLELRGTLTKQANRLEDEANSLIEDVEMGDVQFDEEGGEGDTMVVERERDLVLSAQARHEVEEIDAALERIKRGEYGYSVHSGLPIPRERLKAIPWTQESVQERVGGIGRR